MCGINGIWNAGNPQDELGRIGQMNAALAHRGPDASGVWQDARVTLGHRRLSIIDTSPSGNQPMHSTDGRFHIVFNGELYNYRELRQQLHTANFVSQSDTEVVMAAWQHWGPDALERMQGMFAFALWDSLAGVLYLVRDRLGVKPLYYTFSGPALLFSSELRGLLAAGKTARRINRTAMVDFLKFATVHAPATIVEDIHMLMPGHMLVCGARGVEHRCYWDLLRAGRRDVAAMPPGEVKSGIRELLQQSVEMRMRADVPFGAFLSGGIDSSAITGLMAAVSDQPVRTFSVTFSEKEFDESPYAEIIARKFRTSHTRIHLTPDAFLEALPDALSAMDHPSGDGPNTYVVSKVTRASGIKMALSGIGGDELFCGYPVFRQIRELENKRWLRMMPSGVRALAGGALAALKPSVASEKIRTLLRQGDLDFLHTYPLKRRVLSDEQVRRLWREPLLPADAVQQVCAACAATWLPLMSKISAAEMTTYLPNVLLRDTDQMSMAHSLEVREPFLDHRLVEFVLGVGDNLKFPHTPKQLLTESLGDLLPHDIIQRPKMGFTLPWAHWMKHELKAWCEGRLLLLQRVEDLRHDEVMRMWNDFLRGDRRMTWSRIWPLVVLGHWIDRHDVN